MIAEYVVWLVIGLILFGAVEWHLERKSRREGKPWAR